jgi:hypothetical protein
MRDSQRQAIRRVWLGYAFSYTDGEPAKTMLPVLDQL